jgi:hypothetical protein
MRISFNTQRLGGLAFCVMFAFSSMSFMSSLWSMRSVWESVELQQEGRVELALRTNGPAIASIAEEPPASYFNDDFSLEVTELSPSIPAWVYFFLLALQCGFQPILVKAFTPKTIIRSTAVLAQEVVKLLVSVSYLCLSGTWQSSTEHWTMTTAILAAGLPATIFVIQNYCNLMATQALPPITFSVLNQTKTLSAALCCFLLLGKSQSRLQMVSLFLLVMAALVIQQILPIRHPCPRKKSNQQLLVESEEDKLEEDDGEEEKCIDLVVSETPRQQRRSLSLKNINVVSSPRSSGSTSLTKIPDFDDVNDETTSRSGEWENDRQYSAEKNREPDVDDVLTKGVIPALVASFLSGLAGALSQKTLQFHERSPHLFNTELACFSSFFLLSSLALGSPDGQLLRRRDGGGFMQGWTWKTWIPVVTNAAGAILVGLVTKHQGAVRKGFALIFGMLISGLLQHIIATKNNGTGEVTREQIIGGLIGAVSLWMHSSFPPAAIAS